MIKIGLFCAAGFSTGMLVNNMKIAAEKRNVEVEIEAYAQSKLCDCVEGIDVALLGPQVSYTFDQSEAICKDCEVPLAVIPMMDYGMLDGDKVLNLALSLSKKKATI
ncbi:PTS system, cellobiose-specific IIB component [Enterococcus sp. AZ194]|uniref:PTS sugar transporter subunit IIB n=1 Tax=Enterococcus sp. AZ194 TaxID=2774629 RepID=UPI003F2566EB